MPGLAIGGLDRVERNVKIGILSSVFNCLINFFNQNKSINRNYALRRLVVAWHHVCGGRFGLDSYDRSW